MALIGEIVLVEVHLALVEAAIVAGTAIPARGNQAAEATTVGCDTEGATGLARVAGGLPSVADGYSIVVS